MSARLNHIGIATVKPQELERLFAILGLKIGHFEAVPEQGVRAHFLDLPKADAHLEFLEPTDQSSPVAKFMEKNGPGIHHLSFQLGRGELLPICEKLKKEGYRLIYDRPREGAHSMLINFIHPSSAGGVLIELAEPKQA